MKLFRLLLKSFSFILFANFAKAALLINPAPVSGIIELSKSQNYIYLSNTGATDQSLNLSISSNPQNIKVEVNRCGSILKPNKSCYIIVSFANVSTSSAQVNVDLLNNSSLISTLRFSPPSSVSSLSISPSSLSLGTITRLGSSTAKSFTITNTGNSSITPSLSVSGNGLSIVLNRCNISLLPGKSCQASVYFNAINTMVNGVQSGLEFKAKPNSLSPDIIASVSATLSINPSLLVAPPAPPSILDNARSQTIRTYEIDNSIVNTALATFSGPLSSYPTVTGTGSMGTIVGSIISGPDIFSTATVINPLPADPAFNTIDYTLAPVELGDPNTFLYGADYASPKFGHFLTSNSSILVRTQNNLTNSSCSSSNVNFVCSGNFSGNPKNIKIDFSYSTLTSLNFGSNLLSFTTSNGDFIINAEKKKMKKIFDYPNGSCGYTYFQNKDAVSNKLYVLRKSHLSSNCNALYEFSSSGYKLIIDSEQSTIGSIATIFGERNGHLYYALTKPSGQSIIIKRNLISGNQETVVPDFYAGASGLSAPYNLITENKIYFQITDPNGATRLAIYQIDTNTFYRLPAMRFHPTFYWIGDDFQYITHTANYVYIRYTTSVYRINKNTNDIESVGLSTTYGTLGFNDTQVIKTPSFVLIQTTSNSIMKIDNATDQVTMYNIGLSGSPIQLDPNNPNILRANSAIYNFSTNKVNYYNAGFEYYISAAGGIHTTHGSFYQGGVYVLLRQDSKGFFYKVAGGSHELFHGNNNTDVFTLTGGALYYIEP